MMSACDVDQPSEAALLQGYGRNARDAVRWVHGSWLAAALGLDVDLVDPWRKQLINASQARIDQCSHALLLALGIQTPTLEALLAGEHAVLDTLPVEKGLCALRMRSLTFRRADMRHIIDKRVRTRLSHLIGLPLDTLMAAVADAADSPVDMTAVTRCNLPALDCMDEVMLALEGAALISRDTKGGSFRSGLLHLALPRDRLLLQALHLQNSRIDMQGTTLLLRHIRELLGGAGWLSG